MERSLFGFIWRYSKRQQIVILALTVCSFPILYMTLELPKWIVNDAISGSDFPKMVMGMELGQIQYLVALCIGFLALVVANNGVKYVLNIYKGVAGERMLRRLRYMLYNSILRFRLPRFRRVSGGELIPMITAEVEDVGVFIGEAIATPAFQGGTLLVYMVFIFAQDVFLGAAAIALFPLQAYIIPLMQKKVIRLSRERIINVRAISERINETVSAAPDILANDTSRYHLADLSDRLFLNYRIRLAIFKRKFMIKFLNNFMNQLPPFFFYSIGGYLVIRGDLSFGALVAVLAAYKDLASPWKELLTWYQTLAGVNVKYETVVENFDVDDAIPAERLAGGADAVVDLPDTTIALHSVSASAGGSGQEIIDVTLEVNPGDRLAIYGADGSGRTELVMAMAGLLSPIAGRSTLGGRRLDELTQQTIARYVSYVGSDPYLFNETIRSNIVYGLKTDPVNDDQDDLSGLRRAEAMLTGNSLHDVAANWEDHSRAGVDAAEALDERLLELVTLVGLEGDLYRLGLASYAFERDDPDFRDKILKARADVVRQVREDKSWKALVALWEPKTLNYSATIGENVLYGVPRAVGTPVWAAASDPNVIAALAKAGVDDRLVAMGADVAGTMIELFSDTGADASLIGDYSFLSAEEIPQFTERLRRHKAGEDLAKADRAAFIGLAFRLIPGRHRIVTLTPDDESRLVGARSVIHDALKDDANYALFDSGTVIPPLSIEENILFGKPRVDRRGASDKIDALLRDTTRALGLRDPIARAGLNFNVGIAGGRLSGGQRRRIGLIRAMIKTPQVLILDSVVDGDRPLLARVLEACGTTTVVTGTADPKVAEAMGTVAAMRDGRLVARGGWDSVRNIAVYGEDDDAREREAS
ncbi:ABC transporter ATP-binding protein/permease [Acuticoccus yangtzensis]|uniref:ABC transporter ATP-binding protein/permease n=1 Tax=Acuticoccus yangtzensis TaxID=1443441 RepID=UPI0009494E1D|nr:ABC transporter ATP-binding protein/permease [Acuticoccus yangtzensis]